MLRTLVLLFLVVASAVAADVTGTWEFSVQTDAGSGSPTFVLKQDGEKVSGTYSGLLGEAKVIGTVKGQELVLEFEASGTKVRYVGKAEGNDQVKGTVEFGGEATGTFTGKKK